ncbi:BTAD domain-containing putative transcriptional regulator [Gordonia sp. ABSL1-1]|uniref:BTAD domain-containing putative transcriptional regulator n=1 Tax=Gordonia sp. ABSL1-1 TaxID=3053923 RepID=UPI0025729355|nr:BTAD domain-containing putative transcriptional regulator [Gordonia sp. ABSL1-1]MDL9937239.1 BTAD domain-containing putative transcriptional regulator [Gordonia sp. ABSL1-1]
MTRPYFSVLGGLGAQLPTESATPPGAGDAGNRVDLGTRKQRVTLAQLILADGAPVSVDRLITGIWGDDPPDRAEVSLQAYISGLRKALEPDRRPRAPSTVLLTHGAGYSLPTDDEQVDLRRLVANVTEAKEMLARHEASAAATVLREVLAVYRPLLPEFEGLPFRDEAALHLERMLGVARELSYEARLAIGDHRLLVGELERAIEATPLDENLWTLLATSHYRLGRQSEALAAIADARRILAEEIGVDPGPRLRRLESDILDQADHLEAPAPPSPTLVPTPSATPGAAGPDTAPAGTNPGSPADDDPSRLVGRVDELAVLHRAVVASMSGPGGVVIVEGEPGAGKTALLEEAARRARNAADVTVLWGRCIDDAAVPSMWPWVQILGSVLPQLDPDDRARLLDTDLGRMVTAGVTVIPPPRTMPDAAARFGFYDQAADLLDGVTRHTQLIIVLDDVQWADSASLELFAHMASRGTRGVTFYASLRSSGAERRAAVDELSATIARLPGHHRFEVGPLVADDISELIRRETREWPGAGTVDSILRRTGGNAFFIRELTRILAAHGSIADDAVPAGVRDVVQQRLRELPRRTRDILDVAAIIGSSVDLVLLAATMGAPVDDTLDDLDPATTAGIVDAGDDPFAFSFSHDLIREAVVAGIGAIAQRRIHLAVADALDREATPHRTVRVARHLWSAGPLADRARTAQALVDAGQIALSAYDFEAARRHLTDAATLARQLGDDRLELAAITTDLAARVARDGYFAADAALQSRARELASAFGDARLLAALDYARAAAHLQIADVRVGSRLAARFRTHAEGSDDAVVTHLGMHVAAIAEFGQGHLGSALRILDQYAPLDDVPGIRPDQMVLARGFRAWTTTLCRDTATGRALFDAIEPDPGDRLATLGVAIFAASAASMVGDIGWARSAGGRLLTVDAQGPLDYLRQGGERMYWWSRAMAGDHDEALDNIDRLTVTDRPQRTGIGFWLALHAEALLAAGRVGDAHTRLLEAQSFADRTGEQYPTAHRLIVEAMWSRADGQSSTIVGELLTRACRIAADQEAPALVDRVTRTATTWGITLGAR